MKIVFTLFVAAAAAAAQVDFNDDDLALIQLRSAKHPKHGHEEALVDVGKTGGAAEEAAQAQADADGALALANNALNTAFQSEDDAQAAQDDAAADAGATANAGQADEAQAVGDPHLTLSNGKKADLCCHGGKCKPCKSALLQTTGDAQAEAAQAQAEADEAQQMATEAQQEAQDAQAEAQQAQQDAVAEAAQAANAGQQDEAEAVGDPHMKLSNGKKADLCCDGHLCKKCTKSALLQHDKKESKTHDALADAQAAEAAAQEAQAVAQQAQDEATEAQTQADAAAAAAAAAAQQDVAAVPVVVDPANQEEAAAVGDPHLTLKNGEKKEMCCKGKHCKPC